MVYFTFKALQNILNKVIVSVILFAFTSVKTSSVKVFHKKSFLELPLDDCMQNLVFNILGKNNHTHYSVLTQYCLKSDTALPSLDSFNVTQ